MITNEKTTLLKFYTGKIVDWFTDKNVRESFRDQFAPYEGYGMDSLKEYAGML